MGNKTSRANLVSMGEPNAILTPPYEVTDNQEAPINSVLTPSLPHGFMHNQVVPPNFILTPPYEVTDNQEAPIKSVLTPPLPHGVMHNQVVPPNFILTPPHGVPNYDPTPHFIFTPQHGVPNYQPPPNYILTPQPGVPKNEPPPPNFILTPPHGVTSNQPPPNFILTPQYGVPNDQLPPQNSIHNPLPTILPQQQQQLGEPRNYYACRELLEGGRRREYNDICVPLHEAAITGDWEAARRILQLRPFLVWYSINENWETALHVAATAQSTKFVKHLVEVMSMDMMQLENKQGNTALCLAATAGNVEIAKIMVEKNPQLLVINGSQIAWPPHPEGLYGTQNMMPLLLASLFGKRDMVTYLYDKSQEMKAYYRLSNKWDWIFLKCIEADLYDVALRIWTDHEEDLFLAECEGSVLQILARKPSAFNDIKPYVILRIIKSVCFMKVGPSIKEGDAIQLVRKIWKKVVEKPKDDIDNLLKGPMIVLEKPKDETGDLPEGQVTGKDEMNIYPSQILFVATEMGNTKFILELIRGYPDLIWKRNDIGQTIFHIAVSYRREGIYSLLHEIGSLKDLITTLIDKQGNNMLHLVGKMGEKNSLEHVLGAAFQMQRELLWFKEVAAMIPPSYKEQKNNAGQTPREVFVESHKDLVSQGEKWMKGTANQSMVVAALITTIVFSVAFTIPGGYDQNSGFPIFLRDGPFIAFVILDAISLILSSASILMFLSILTSRYAQNDFLQSLPEKLMIGLATLFLSIVTMMITFTVSFFILYRKNLSSIPVIISAVAVIPIFLYAKLQFPLLVDVYLSTYSSKYLLKPKNRMIYYRNPRF